MASHEYDPKAELELVRVLQQRGVDALVLVGQHGVYCQSARQPGKPAMDVQMILAGIVVERARSHAVGQRRKTALAVRLRRRFARPEIALFGTAHPCLTRRSHPPPRAG